ncbi:tannase/feruloyl esterase family alpha/beta hydrolase [Ramlibacter sp. USB13]|uniref:Tannase/feruloyl esterase family alpha/beta hydrolase n=1 Tax=Ramlibacter cellulosilyticus TaxID=2764187 RepID=A0A923MP84_9BURK|nr:tannase/feruloyl esterase family alpha/beta hydrolase [Ramlibacter cellulosilyticus]MBC5781327.1 tannase/feruloyl esterase family alpha/beta hydrolase [Ramlibacter cellulosilyticus]
MTSPFHPPKRLAALFAAAALSACGGGGGGGITEAPAPAPAAPVAKACAINSFADLKLENATVLSAEPVAANSYQPAGARNPIANLSAFCLVKGQSRPSADSLVNFELWVPQDGWNGKMVTTGNGGYSPALSYNDMAYAMRQGYAVMGGDTGHQSTDPNEMFWGVGHPEKIKDWGTRSINAITVPGKGILAHLQGQSAKRAYYYGCSTGGHQGYAEVQQYPQDFDGVIAGAPGNNRVALNVEFLWRYQSNRVPNTNTTLLTNAKAALITQKAVAACDGLDGVTDGVIADPRACTTSVFNVESLQCTGADAPDCLTADQVTAAKKIYAGPKNPRTGAQIYPGLAVGTESGWPGYWGGAAPVRSDFWALWVFDNPQWNWWTFDYDRDLTFSLSKVGPLVDQNNADISAFKARGGKLITYQGWSDPVVNAMDTIAYYEKVRTAQGSQQATDSFFRLFLAPGMGHCSGGTGPTVFGNSAAQAPNPTADNDLLMALDRWVEQGAAPEAIVASRVQSGAVTASRPLCPYPKKAVYKGSGDVNAAANFSCQ